MLVFLPFAFLLLPSGSAGLEYPEADKENSEAASLFLKNYSASNILNILSNFLLICSRSVFGLPKAGASLGAFLPNLPGLRSAGPSGF
jgi:hypothetical protein